MPLFNNFVCCRVIAACQNYSPLPYLVTGWDF
jgi:hypothetical protein